MYCMPNVYFLRIDIKCRHYASQFALCASCCFNSVRVVSRRIFEGRRVTGFDWIEHNRAKGLVRRCTIALAAEALK